MIMLTLLAQPLPGANYMAMHEAITNPNDGIVLASPLEKNDDYSTNGPFGFNANGIVGGNSSDAIYPAFNYSLSEIEQPENMDLTINSSVLPIPDLMSETGTPSLESSTSADAGEMTQSAIEKMVNPSSLLSSAIDDIRESGSSNSQGSQDVQPTQNKSISFLNTKFSTIPLYGMNIPPKDYLVVSSDEVGSSETSKLFATSRIPCDDKHETSLRVVLLENWSSIVYPPPRMHLIDGNPDGGLCVFRSEYPEVGIVDSYISPTVADKSLVHDDIAPSIAIALYNSGSSALKFPMASSITISNLGSP
jgi:hypothetical protein